MYRTAYCFFVFVFTVSLFILGAANYAHAESTYLSEDQDQILPYLNDSRKNARFRGGDQFVFIGGEKTKLTTGLVRDENGTLYYVADGILTAMSPEGKILWSYQLSFNSGVETPVLGADDELYICIGDSGPYEGRGTIYSFNRNGQLDWVFQRQDVVIRVGFNFAVDPNGNFVFESDKGIVSMAPGGQMNWINTDLQVLTKKTFSRKITYESSHFLEYDSNVNDIQTDKLGNIIVQLKDEIAALDREGKVIWRKPEKDWFYLEEGTVYVQSMEGLRAYDAATGESKPVIPEAIPLSSDLPHDHEGGFYKTVGNGIAKMTADGEIIWTYTFKGSGYGSSHQFMRSDAEGNLYFSTNGASVFSLDKEGNERFALLIQQRNFNPSDIVVDSVGSLFLLSDTTGFSRIIPKEKNIRIRLDNREVRLSTLPVAQNGTTMLPMRELFELLEAEINWDNATQTVTARKDNKQISVTVGSVTAYLNGTAILLDEPPFMKNGITMIPLRFAAETLEYEIAWDPDKRIVQLSSGIVSDSDNTIAPRNIQSVIMGEQKGFYLLADGNWKKVLPEKKRYVAGDEETKGIHVEVEFFEKTGDFDLSIDQMEEYILNAIKKLYTQPQLGEGSSITVGKTHALQWQFTEESDSGKLRYLATLYESEDRFYLLQISCAEEKFQESLPLMNNMVGSFRWLDEL